MSSRNTPHASTGAPEPQLCLAFVNTVEVQRDDLQPGYANLLAWGEEAGAVPPEWAARLRRQAKKEARSAAAVRRRAIVLREALGRILHFLIAGTAPEPEDLANLQQEIAAANAYRRLYAIDGILAWRWSDELVLERVLWPVVASAEALLLSPNVRRVRECAGEGCARLFLDTTKNGSRRFCSAAGCGTRERVRRFRERAASA